MYGWPAGRTYNVRCAPRVEGSAIEVATRAVDGVDQSFRCGVLQGWRASILGVGGTVEDEFAEHRENERVSVKMSVGTRAGAYGSDGQR